MTLGGGVGWMVRKHGLTIDNLVGARVVTVDGQLVTTSKDEHPDLFYGLRGGGGNFGVVVDFDFVAQPVQTVHFGTIGYRLDDPADVLRGWRDAMRVAPDELTSTPVLPPASPQDPIRRHGNSPTMETRTRAETSTLPRSSCRFYSATLRDHCRTAIRRNPSECENLDLAFDWSPETPWSRPSTMPSSRRSPACTKSGRHDSGPQPGRSVRQGADPGDRVPPSPCGGDDRRNPAAAGDRER